MKLSYVIVTFNRREALLRTLGILHRTTPLPLGEWETWVVDNGSTDGSLEAVRQQFPDVHLIARPANEGVWSRSYAFAPARGQYLILLDDDSYPIGDAAAKSIDYLETHPACAAVVGLVVLPDGSFEACAFPAVMLSGARLHSQVDPGPNRGFPKGVLPQGRRVRLQLPHLASRLQRRAVRGRDLPARQGHDRAKLGPGPPHGPSQQPDSRRAISPIATPAALPRRLAAAIHGIGLSRWLRPGRTGRRSGRRGVGGFEKH